MKFFSDLHRQWYEALGDMERARSALRDAAWWYWESGRECSRGLQLDAAASTYADARAAYYVINRRYRMERTR